MTELKDNVAKAKYLNAVKYADPVRKETVDWFKSQVSLSKLSRILDHVDSIEHLLKTPEGNDVLLAVKNELFAYITELSQILRENDEPTDLNFTYEGFRIENPDLLSMADLKRILASVDYLVYIFKRRGAKRSLLDESVKKIIIRDRQLEDGYRAAAFYTPANLTVTLFSDITSDGGRMLKNWIDEVLIHEIGHHVHMFLLHPEAVASWDSAWNGINTIKKQGVVTPADRKRYWKAIEASDYDYGVAGRKFKGVDRTKYLLWLYAAGPVGGTKTPYISSVKVVKPTMTGLKASEFFKDSRGFILKNHLASMAGNPSPEEVESRIQAAIDKLKAKHYEALRLDDTRDGPVFDPTADSQFFKQDPEAAQAIMNLNVPTNYGRTNHQEDFAETFVLFMTEPQRLSETARFRMSRALSLSGLFGKEIVKLGLRLRSRRVVNRYLVRCQNYER